MARLRSAYNSATAATGTGLVVAAALVVPVTGIVAELFFRVGEGKLAQPATMVLKTDALRIENRIERCAMAKEIEEIERQGNRLHATAQVFSRRAGTAELLNPVYFGSIRASIMSRWRPPPVKSTTLITAAGMSKLQQELDDLWRRQRPEVVRALAAAAAEGDRSENAEYTYRKKQLGGIDRRVRYLSKRIPALHIATQKPPSSDAVFFGARVVLEDATGKRHTYCIVGPDEIDMLRGWISIDAPLTRALLKHHSGDEVNVVLPSGYHTYTIVTVSYPDAPWSEASPPAPDGDA